jgi:hypothetical protein
MGRRKGGDPDHIRLLNDGLIDGQGLRWDRVTGAHFYMTPNEARPFVDAAWRYLSTRGMSNRTDIIERTKFLELMNQSPDPLVQAFRAADGSGRLIMTIDTSDC